MTKLISANSCKFELRIKTVPGIDINIKEPSKFTDNEALDDVCAIGNVRFPSELPSKPLISRVPSLKMATNLTSSARILLETPTPRTLDSSSAENIFYFVN
jgi:hypothetical protein